MFVVSEGVELFGRKYRVMLTYLRSIFCPGKGAIYWRHCDAAVIPALDSSLLSFTRLIAADDLPEWFLVDTNAYCSTQNPFQLSPEYFAKRGYYAGLKTCMARLLLVSDMSVTVFLSRRSMIDLMCSMGGYRSQDDILHEATI